MTIFQEISEGIARLDNFQRRLKIDYRKIDLGIKLHKEKILDLKNSVTREKVKDLENYVQSFTRFLKTDDHGSEGLREIQSETEEENKIVEIIESDISKLREQISELPVGNARDELFLFLREIESLKAPSERLNKINQATKGLLLKLDRLIKNEIELLEKEYNIFVSIEHKGYNEVNDEIEELLSIVGDLQLNIKIEYIEVVQQLIALIDQKKEVRRRIEGLKGQLEHSGELNIERIKEDLRHLNPLQAKEYLNLLQNLFAHYLNSDIDLNKIKKAWGFVNRFRSFFEGKRTNIEARKKQQESSRYTEVLDLARVDPLTGLKNRRSMDEELKIKIKQLRRKSGVFGFMMIDIDNFKSVNDTYGHNVGDIVLKLVAEALKSILRAEDSAFRYGGEEIAILLSNNSNETSLGVIGNRMRERVTQKIEIEKQRNDSLSTMGNRRITISIGAVLVSVKTSRETNDIQEMINLIQKEADKKLYEAKNQGRDQVRVAGIDI